MLKANKLRVGNKFKSCFGNVETVLSIMDNTDNGRIKVCTDCPDNVPHYKSEHHRDMYSHLILCQENGNQYKPCEIEGIPLTEEWLKKFGFKKHNDCVFLADGYWVSEGDGFIISGELVIKFYGGIKQPPYEITSNIKYIHQLQNIYFSLTEEELILN